MALTIKFWGFGKKENSTIIPTSNPLITYNNAELKDSCSLVNPAIKIYAPAAQNVQTYNYCQIQEFNRYYFVTDWIWSNGVWICELEVDVLASFRLEIGFQSLYVLRASFDTQGRADFDGNIIDTTYPATAEAPTYINYSERNPLADQYNTGTFIVGIINQDASGVSYYCFNSAGFTEFCGELFNYSSGWVNIDPTEISEDLQKALINPFQYIASAFFLPIPFSWWSEQGAGQPTHIIKFGWWSVTISATARVIPKNVLYEFESSLTIPKHPQEARGNYLNLNPYSVYTLRYYPFGVFDIDSEAISNYNVLKVRTAIDTCTGQAIITLFTTTVNNPIRVIEANVSVQIPTVSVNVDYMNLGSKTSALAAGAAVVSQLGAGSSGNWFQNFRTNAKSFIANLRAGNREAVSSSVKEAVTNITSAVFASKATAEITGQQGAYTLFNNQYLTLAGRFIPIAQEDFGHRGRPLCQVRQINTLRGFIICADADVVITCTDREKSAIQAYLEGGFYYEE